MRTMNPESIEGQRREIENSTTKNEQKVVFDEKNYLNTRLKPGETTREIRIRLLTATPTSDTPFLVLKAHNMRVDKAVAESGFKMLWCLNDPHINAEYGNHCPICAKSDEYFKQANECNDTAMKKSLFKAGYAYKPKKTFIARCIERGKENEGVKFWKFNEHSDGTGVYDMLMSIYDQRRKESIEAGQEPYNVFDLYNGKDFIIKLTYTPTTGRTTMNIVDAGFQSPLSKDEEQMNQWLNDPKTWNEMYAVRTPDYLTLIADGKVPYFDKNEGRYKAKDVVEMENQQIDMEAAHILNESSTQSVHSEPKQESPTDDLPF